MIFVDTFHKEFYESNTTKDNKLNSFFYLIGTKKENIKNINKIFDKKTKEVFISVIEESWVDEDNKKILRAAINLYTGIVPVNTYNKEEFENNSLINLFNTEYAPYIYQAIMIIYPDKTNHKTNFTERNAGRKLKFDDDDFEKMKKLSDKGLTYQEIADEFNTTKVTVLKTFKRNN